MTLKKYDPLLMWSFCLYMLSWVANPLAKELKTTMFEAEFSGVENPERDATLDWTSKLKSLKFTEHYQKLYKANNHVSRLPAVDPSSWQAFSCVVSKNLNYQVPRWGSVQARVYHPVATNLDCSNLTPPPLNRPIVLFYNGQGYKYYDYDYIAKHIAGIGFVVVTVQTDEPDPTVHCNGSGQLICIEDRTRKGIAFLNTLRSLWSHSASVDYSRIITMGHSRGGEAAVVASSIIAKEESFLGNPGVHAVISLAPTDFGASLLEQDSFRVSGTDSGNFLVLYGSKDEDTTGWSQSDPPLFAYPYRTAFSLYERAGTEESIEGFPIANSQIINKSMHYIYKANHKHFSDRSTSTSICGPSIARSKQYQITKGLVSAYLLWTYYGITGYKAYFDAGDDKFWDIDSFQQFSSGGWGSRRVLDNFQNGDLSINSLGGSLSASGNLNSILITPADRPRLPHGPSQAITLSITPESASASNILRWNIPGIFRNISSFKYLSFRVGRNGYSGEDLSINVRMRSNYQWSPVLSTEDYGRIPVLEGGPYASLDEPATNCVADRGFAHMRTIRIPLVDFNLDFSNSQTLQFRFQDPNAIGKEIFIDNIEFTEGSENIESSY